MTLSWELLLHKALHIKQDRIKIYKSENITIEWRSKKSYFRELNGDVMSFNKIQLLQSAIMGGLIQ